MTAAPRQRGRLVTRIRSSAPALRRDGADSPARPLPNRRGRAGRLLARLDAAWDRWLADADDAEATTW